MNLAVAIERGVETIGDLPAIRSIELQREAARLLSLSGADKTSSAKLSYRRKDYPTDIHTAHVAQDCRAWGQVSKVTTTDDDPVPVIIRWWNVENRPIVWPNES